MEFPRSVSVDADLSIELLDGYAESLGRHGFEYLVLLPSRGGNFAPVESVGPEIVRERESVDLITLGRRAVYRTDGRRAETGWNRLPGALHPRRCERDHIMLAVHEDLVGKERRERGREGPVSVSALLGKGFNVLTDSGLLGDARESSSDAGEAIGKNVAETYAEEIGKA